MATGRNSKDSSYGTRPLTDEERAYYQELVDTINETFINSVAEGRDMTVEEVRALATGMQFAGTVAVENGLADGAGASMKTLWIRRRSSAASSRSMVRTMSCP